jgi:hypothetical protein
MHGLNTIVRLNKVQQDFVDRILTAPRPPEQNLLEVWRDWKAEKEQSNEPVQVHPL